MPKTFWFGQNSVTFDDDVPDDVVQTKLAPLVEEWKRQHAVGDVARQRLAAQGLTPEAVKGAAAAGEDVPTGNTNAPVNPTTGERIKSGTAATFAGIADILNGMGPGTVESAVNLAGALPRSIGAAGKTLVEGGSLGDAFDAAKNVKPYRGLTEPVSNAITSGQQKARDAMGVRPNANTDAQDAALRLAPQAVAAIAGGAKLLRGRAPIEAAAETAPEPVVGDEGPVTSGAPVPDNVVQMPRRPPAPESAADVAKMNKAESEAAWKALPLEKKAEVLEGIRFDKDAGPADAKLRSLIDGSADLPTDPEGISAMQMELGPQRMRQLEQATRSQAGPDPFADLPEYSQEEMAADRTSRVADEAAQGAAFDAAVPPGAPIQAPVRAQRGPQTQMGRGGQMPPPPPPGGGGSAPEGPSDPGFYVMPNARSVEPPIGVEPVSRNRIVKGLSDLYNSATPMATDAIERQGPHGFQFAAVTRSARAVGDSRTSTMNAAIDTATKGFTDGEADQLGALLEGEQPTGGVDPKVIRAYQVVDNVRRTVAGLASKQIDDFVPMEDYLTHIGKRAEDMPEPVRQLASRAGHEEYSLTRSRGEGSIRPQGLDVIRATKRYVAGANRMIAEHEAFASRSPEGLASKVDEWARAVQESGYNGDLVKRYGSSILGGGARADTLASKITGNIMAIESGTKTPFAPLRHIHQLAFDAPELGISNTASGILRGFAANTGMAPETQSMITEAGILQRNMLREDLGFGSSTDAFSRGTRKFANASNFATRIIDSMKASMTGVGAAHRFDEIVDTMHGKSVPLVDRAMGDLRPTAQIVRAGTRELARAGISPDMLQTPEGLRQARSMFMHMKVNDIQRGTTLADTPAWSQTPAGRMLYWAQRPAVFGVDFLLNRVAKPAMSGNMKPLVAYLATAPVVAWAAEKIPSMINGQEAPAQEKLLRKVAAGEDISAEDMKDFALESYTPHGIIRHGGRAAKGVAGAIGQTITNHLGAYSAAYDDVTKGIGKAIDERSPGPLLERDMRYHYGKKLLARNGIESPGDLLDILTGGQPAFLSGGQQ